MDDQLPADTCRLPFTERQLSRAALLRGSGGLGILLAAGGPSLVGCSDQTSTNGSGSGSPKRGGSLHAAVNTDAPTLDWTVSTSTITAIVAYHMFEQLFTYDQHFSVRPMLAAGYKTSADHLTYTIKLRENVSFHDGSIMTAQDVVASIKRWGEISSTGQDTVKYIRTVRPLDKSTVRIELNSVFEPLISSLASLGQPLVVIPAKTAEAAGKQPMKEDQLIGTGPYKFANWTRGRSIKLTRFNNYSARTKQRGGLAGKKTAYLDEITANVIKEPQVRLNNLQAGEVDYALELSTDSYDQIRSMGTVEPVLIKPAKWLGLFPNKAKGPFTDVRLRQAANAALQKKKIAQAAYGDKKFWEIDGSLFPPEAKALYTTTGTDNYLDYDVDKAKRLMKEAGYRGERIRILLTNLYPDHYNGGQVMGEQLKKVGFNVDLQVLDWPTLLKRREEEDSYELFVTTWAHSLFEPSSLTWLSPSYAGWYRSKRMQSLLDSWAKATKEDQKDLLLAKITKVFYEEVPAIKIANSVNLAGRSAKLLDYEAWIHPRFWNAGFS